MPRLETESGAMHEFGKFLQSLMDSENMKPADLARRSGLSRQLVWNLLSDAEMKTIPKVETLSGLRKAFPAVPYTTWVLRAAASAGIPVEEEPIVDYSALSNEALLGILHERLTGGSNDASAAEAQKNDELATRRATWERENPGLNPRAAQSGRRSRGKAIDDEMNAAGEESQDPGEGDGLD